MKITFDNSSLDLTPNSKGWFVTFGDKTISVEILHAKDGRLDLLIDGEPLTAFVSVENSKSWVTIHGRTSVLTKQSNSRRSTGGHHHTAGELTAPMPGQVRMVNVSEGDVVVKGQTLVVLEAMKMEIRIQASMDGIVQKVFVKAGQTVEREQMAIEIQ